ncbi:hypothetical protein QBC32DRAFT_107385 [Pseudoneurospora amorphoporcata]|uniref:Uncharacterized protein n=1 Tax=Pseudoneurospora amorphoporcata TaxID=241081 RepID=A0AAN6SBE9_9PEZI|nr:hypothetical protein QBC32DRAFT_107385 [Pseudoneurospora amorphoporcata]
MLAKLCLGAKSWSKPKSLLSNSFKHNFTKNHCFEKLTSPVNSARPKGGFVLGLAICWVVVKLIRRFCEENRRYLSFWLARGGRKRYIYFTVSSSSSFFPLPALLHFFSILGSTP